MRRPVVAAVTLSIGPHWLALLREGAGALGRVLGRPDRLGDGTLPLERLTRRPVPAFPDNALGRGDRYRPVPVDLPGERDGLRQGPAVSSQPVYQAEVRRALGGHRLAGQRQLHGDVIRDALGQPEQAARAGYPAAAYLGQPEPGRRGGHDEIAGEHDLEAAAEGVPLHRGDQRLGGPVLDHPGEPAPGYPRVITG